MLFRCWEECFPCDRPDTSNGCNDSTRDRHRPQTPCALEQGPAQEARSNAVGRIMLPTQISNVRVDAVVHDGDDASRVAQEWAPPCDRVQCRVQPQLGRLASAAPETLLQPPCTTYRQGGEVCDAGPVAKIVCEAARGEDGLPAGQVGDCGFLEGDVLEGVLVEAGEGV